MFTRALTLATALLALTTSAHAVQYMLLDLDGPGWVEVETQTGEVRCDTPSGPTKSLIPATHVTLGPGDGWGAVALGATVKVYGQPSCDSGLGVAIDVPAAGVTWTSWRLLPRAADGTVYAPSTTHLMAIETNPPALRELLAWSDLAAFVGVTVLAEQLPWDAVNVGAAVALPSGELWLLVAIRDQPLRVIGVKPEGQLRLVAELPKPGSDIRGQVSMAWADSLDAAIIGRQFFTIPVTGEPLWRVTFLPASVPFPVRSPPTVHERHLPEWVTTLPVESGVPLLGVNGPMSVAEVLAFDLDQDGLTSAEAGLGTSPWSADTDGDGALDGTESVLFGTDPTNRDSAPAAGPVSDFAPSSLINDWVTLAAPDADWPHSYYMSSDRVANSSGTGVVCVAGTCFHDDGAALAPTLPDDPDIALMLSGEGFVEPTGSGVRTVMFGGSEQQLALDAPEPAQTIAVDGSEIYFRANTINGLEIHRYSAGEMLVVVDADRHGCPIVATPAELAACGTAPPLAERTQVAWAGYDTTHHALIVLAGNDTEWWLTVVTTSGQARILTPADLGYANLLEAELVPLAGGQSLLRLTPRVPSTHTAKIEVMALDERLRPYPSAWPMAADFRGGPRLGEGVFSPLTVSYPIYDDGGHGGPTCFDGECVPELPGGPNIVQYIHTSLGVLWVPRTPNPVLGEAILAVRPHGVAADVGLWRLGPHGEVGPWLGADALHALSGGAFDEIATSAIAAIGSAADGRRLCLVTTSARAVWELSLAADLTPTTLTRVAADVSAPVACGYGPNGELAVLAEAPTRLVLGTSTIDLPEVAAPRGLFAFDGRFVVTGAGSETYCVDATTRALRATGLRLMALARGPGGTISTVDAFGKGALVDLSGLCTSDGRVIVEDFDRAPESLWELGNLGANAPNAPVPSAPRAAIAHAESGMAYIVGFGEDERARNVDPQASDSSAWTLMIGRLWRVRPAYVAPDPRECLAAVDPVRRDATKVRVVAPRANVSAMTVLGDRTLQVEGEDWEYRGIAHTPTPCARVVEVPDEAPEASEVGEVSEPNPDPAPRARDDGCGAGGPSLLTLLALSASLRRRLCRWFGVVALAALRSPCRSNRTCR